jgi:hypothetical protein
MFFADIAGIAWVISWMILYACVILSGIYFALYIIFKIIDFIRKELE